MMGGTLCLIVLVEFGRSNLVKGAVYGPRVTLNMAPGLVGQPAEL